MGSHLLTVLVFGYYKYNGNIGDDLFMEAFKNMFPAYNFIFTDHITSDILKDVNAVFIGGGSFLNEKPTIVNDALKLLLQKNIFYLGVGAETDIHPIHQLLMSKAKLIAIRSDNLEKIKEFNDNVICIPDLVYSLQDKIQQSEKIKNSILVIPNITAVPQYNDPYWQQLSWEHYKIELAQFLDELVLQKYTVNFLPMCHNDTLQDQWAIAEIFNKMTNKNIKLIVNAEHNMESISKVISKYETVLTQRYHGMIVADMCGINHISVYHHDKLKTDNSLSLYEASKDKLYEKLNNIKQENMLIKQNIYKERFNNLYHRVVNLLT